MKVSRISELFIRYILLILLAFQNLFIFSFIFSPATIYPVFFLLKLFFNVYLTKNIVIINNFIKIELIEACIASSAYYLLLILNLSTPNIKLKQRLKAVFFSFGTFLILNIFRIVLLTFLYVEGNNFFDITHKLFWYTLSTIFVIGIWFVEVRLFKIKEVPFYSDIKFLFNEIKKSNKTKSSKKHKNSGN